MKSISRKIFAVIALICIMLGILCLTSCGYWGYDGAHIELYTVAVNNVFGISGYTSNGEISYDPDIDVIYKDDYGRILFFYDECYGVGNDYGMAFAVMQKSDDKYVYYYQDACYVPHFDENYHGEKTEDRVATALKISEKAIEELKERNDWNKELKLDKCTRARIVEEKPEGKIGVNTTSFDDEIYEYAKANGYKGSDDSPTRRFEFCNSDANGKELYRVVCMFSDYNVYDEHMTEWREYAVIVDTDGSIFKNTVITQDAIAEIKDNTQYYDIVKDLKAANGWVDPTE